MPVRREVLGGLAAFGVLPAAGWADVGQPAWVSGARDAAGRFVLVGLGADLRERFRVQLPDRGHAAAAHPYLPHVVAFARRPGKFALVIDCRTGETLGELTAGEGRHFYGHGVFSADGAWLFMTGNDYEAARGVIELRAVAEDYRLVAEFSSGGIGPHDISLLPDGTLAIANGGIETHPDSGRTKLNLATMRPNLTYLSQGGEVLEQVELPGDLRLNSIRHLAVDQAGQVGFAMQWQGDPVAGTPLLGVHRRGETPRLLSAPAAEQRLMQGYAGSIAFDSPGRVVITSPRGARMHIFDLVRGELDAILAAQDICGVARSGQGGLVYTTGMGIVGDLSGNSHQFADLQFDNHLIAL